MTEDIREIWDQVRDGDHLAWRRLVSMYSALVYGVATRVGLTVPDAEDCVQHTWLMLYRRRHAIKDPVSLPAWLIRTTHRRAIYIARRVKPTPAEKENHDRSPDQLPDEVVQQLEYEAMIRQALKEIDPRCRALIKALYLGKKKVSYEQLADSLGVSPNSIGPMRARCLSRLKEVLRKMGLEWD